MKYSSLFKHNLCIRLFWNTENVVYIIKFDISISHPVAYWVIVSDISLPKLKNRVIMDG